MADNLGGHPPNPPDNQGQDQHGPGPARPMQDAWRGVDDNDIALADMANLAVTANDRVAVSGRVFLAALQSCIMSNPSATDEDTTIAATVDAMTDDQLEHLNHTAQLSIDITDQLAAMTNTDMDRLAYLRELDRLQELADNEGLHDAMNLSMQDPDANTAQAADAGQQTVNTTVAANTAAAAGAIATDNQSTGVSGSGQPSYASTLRADNNTGNNTFAFPNLSAINTSPNTTFSEVPNTGAGTSAGVTPGSSAGQVNSGAASFQSTGVLGQIAGAQPLHAAASGQNVQAGFASGQHVQASTAAGQNVQVRAAIDGQNVHATAAARQHEAAHRHGDIDILHAGQANLAAQQATLASRLSQILNLHTGSAAQNNEFRRQIVHAGDPMHDSIFAFKAQATPKPKSGTGGRKRFGKQLANKLHKFGKKSKIARLNLLKTQSQEAM